VAVVEHTRTLRASAFPTDSGIASPDTRRALARAAAPDTPSDYLGAVVALCLDRLLVPVVATATRLEHTAAGLASDKEADMSVVLLQTPDGRRAMLAFTGLDSLRAWDPAARPVPVTLDLAARSAAADGASALLIDFAGPHPLVIDSDVLAQLALGHRLVALPDDEFGWAMPTDGEPPQPPG